MIAGMPVEAFTQLHVAISLVGIATGLVVVIGWIRRRFLPGWTAAFLVSTAATSVTGFMFHSTAFGAPHLFGVISLVALAAGVFALFVRRLSGPWRVVFLLTSILALYLNAFVGIVQTFQKVAFFNAFAPTQTEPPFVAAQAVALLAFVVLGVLAVRRVRQRTDFG